jgi:hypothetical protein
MKIEIESNGIEPWQVKAEVRALKEACAARAQSLVGSLERIARWVRVHKVTTVHDLVHRTTGDRNNYPSASALQTLLHDVQRAHAEAVAREAYENAYTRLADLDCERAPDPSRSYMLSLYDRVRMRAERDAIADSYPTIEECATAVATFLGWDGYRIAKDSVGAVISPLSEDLDSGRTISIVPVGVII